MRYVHPGGWVDKCSFCSHRLADGGEPACVETCPTEARFFGDFTDPASPVRRAIDSADTVGVLNPSTGTDPCLFYLNSHIDARPQESAVTIVSEIGAHHG